MKLTTLLFAASLACGLAHADNADNADQPAPAASIANASDKSYQREGELDVDPYKVSNENAGAAPINDPSVLAAFNGREGIARVAASFVEGVKTDPRTGKIFAASDWVRLERTLNEQFCYILGGGCDYTGRDMASVHKDHGVTSAEFGAVVEILQAAMRKEGVPFRYQNRFLAKLAPMKRDTVTR